ncbi:MAG: hypothetical protein ACRD26_19500 [Vicinamibacterales bacterium]
MTARPLPPRPDLEQLKRQAKELLKAYHAGDAGARARWRADPSAGSTTGARLRDAQRVIARENGLPSWDALRRHVQSVLHNRADAGEEALVHAVTLRERLTPEVAQRLTEQRVTAVKIEASVPPDSLEHLSAVATLRRIDLSGRGDLVDEDLAFIEAMPWLTAVSLAGCRSIRDAGVAYLRRHEWLEDVNLQWTGAGDEAVASLAEKPALHCVVLGRHLTDAGAARLRDFPALRTAGRVPAALAVGTSPALTDHALAWFGDLDGVATLDLSGWHDGSTNYTPRGVAHLQRMAALETLCFRGDLATDAVLPEIARIPRLRELQCQDIVAGDDGFAALGQCAHLENIWGRWCHGITDRGFARLGRLPRLRRLCVGGRGVSDDAMASLVDAPALTELWPFLFGDAAFRSIARMPRLDTLVNMYNRDTTDAATRCLRHHPRLVDYRAFGTQITDESLRVLADLSTLETLRFENCAGITDAGLRELARLQRLRCLSVESCVNVTGTWAGALPATVEASSKPGQPGEAERYLFETLLDFPDVPVPKDVALPLGEAGRADPLSHVVCIGCQAALEDGGIRLRVHSGIETGWVGLLTRESYAVPCRVDVAVDPVGELRLYFGVLRANVGLA